MEDGNNKSPAGDGVPVYSLRVSARAKRMQIKVNSWGKVEVVVPRHVSIGRVDPFVRQHRKWLTRTLDSMRVMRGGQVDSTAALPEKLHFPALGEEWQISYVQDSRARFSATMSDDGRWILRLAAANEGEARAELRRWLQDYARRRLIPWLRTVSEECRLPFARVTVRAQKTRWGSCTTGGHISVNRHLLFLPPPLVRYLFIHELCHTVHLNHSRLYWALVRRHAPDYHSHETELRRAVYHIPLWACPD